MQNSLDTISSSFITSATAANQGSGKADSLQSNTVDGQFSELLNQAFHEQPETQQTSHKNPTTQATKHEEPAADSTTTTTEANEHHQAHATDKPDESHADKDKSVKKADQKEQKPSAQDLQPLLQSLQPIDLTILHTSHLLGHASAVTAQIGEAGESAAAPTTDNTTAIESVNPEATTASTPTASPLTLLPGIGQNMLAFALPGKGPGKGQAAAAGTEQKTDEITGQPVATTQDGLELPAADPKESNSTLSLPNQLASESPTGNGDLTRQANGALEGLAQGVKPVLNNSGLANTTSAKPNASLPSTDMFKKTLDSLHEAADELHAQVESATDSATSSKGAKDADTSSAPDSLSGNSNADLSAFNGTDLLSATGTGNTQTVGGPNGSGPDNGILSFSSLAANPVDQVADGTAYSVKNGQRELIIRLNPNNLGEVRVNLTSHGNQELSARLIASTTESHDLLKGQLDSLKHSLESQGITVDRLTVVLAGAANADSSNNNSHSQHHSSPQQEQQPQQQPNSQQGSAFNQQFNQQNPTANLFSQMGGQSQSQANWTQRLSQATGNADTSIDSGMDSGNTVAPQATSHDNGRISILA